MRITAAVVREPGGAFQVTELELDDPRDDEVIVRIAATGMCHTDLSFRDGLWPFPLPAVLGHEGAGVVERVGARVSRLREGDHVVLSAASCGACPACLRAMPASCRSAASLNMAGSRADGSNALHQNGHDVHGNFVGQSSFASHAIVRARHAVKVGHDLAIETLGPLGCAVQTGAGTVINALRPPAGASIAIFGAGGVGLSAVMASALVGCAQIIAVDLNPARLDLACELGATDVVDAGGVDAAQMIVDLTAGGADFAVEASGAPQALRTALDSIHSMGTCALVGAAPVGTQYTLDSMALLSGRTVRGVTQGLTNPAVFIPSLVDLHRRGRLPFDRLLVNYRFEDINTAADDAASGRVVKPLITAPG